MLAITTLQLKAETSAASDNGSVKVKGSVATAPPADRFFLSTGIGLRVVGGGTLDFFYASARRCAAWCRPEGGFASIPTAA